MNKKVRLTIILTLILIGCSYGQNKLNNGFIITLDNDTIQGKLDYRSDLKSYESCIFKGESGVTEYYPNQILGFGYNNYKLFSSQIIQGSFVEVLIIGEMSLFKSKYKYHIKKDTSIYDLESIPERVEIDGKIGIIEKSKWQGIVRYLISDCLNISNGIPNLKLNEKSLTQIIIKYNKCRGTEYIEFKANKPWTQVNYGITLGLIRSEINISDGLGRFPFLDQSYTSIDPSIGVLVAISSPRITENVAFQLGLHFLKSNYSSLVKLEEGSIQFYDTFIELNTLSIPLSLKYSFPEEKYKFYVEGGSNYDLHLSSNTRLLREQVNGNVVSTFPESSAFEVNNFQIGIWGGIGILKTYRKFRGSIRCSYSQMYSFNNTNGFIANNNRISLNIILFKK
jgi:hypothetical protein